MIASLLGTDDELPFVNVSSTSFFFLSQNYKGTKHDDIYSIPTSNISKISW
jgi:hypothetical protein